MNDGPAQPTTYLIKGVRLVGEAPAGAPPRTDPTDLPVGDLLLRDGVLVEVGPGLSATGARVIDADGLIALPGLVDVHTHLREPGREDAETVHTGSRAAALGGYTAVCAMANTSPVADTAGVVEQVYRLGRDAGLVDVQPIGAVTVGLAGAQLAELGAMAASAARVRMFSDDGNCVADPRLMRRALEYVKAFDGVIAQHSEEPRLTEGSQMHEGEVATRLGLTGWPAVAEEAIIARDVLLAGHVGSRLHVCHVSTAGSVEILRWARRRGVRVTAEVVPHHLLLTDECVAGTSGPGDQAADGLGFATASYDPVFKVNPPLRTPDDVAALRAGLAEGIIDVVATDHAPHAVEDKECEWAYARPGMLGLETALSVVVETMLGRIGWDGIAERMSRAPARIAGLTDAPAGLPARTGVGGHGQALVAGASANLTLVDPAARWTVDPGQLASRSRNTPYAGLRLPARVVATFLRGAPTVLDGKAVR